MLTTKTFDECKQEVFDCAQRQLVHLRLRLTYLENEVRDNKKSPFCLREIKEKLNEQRAFVDFLINHQ